MRLVVFEETAPPHEEVLRLCGHCRARFTSDRERNDYLEAVLLA